MWTWGREVASLALGFLLPRGLHPVVWLSPLLRQSEPRAQPEALTPGPLHVASGASVTVRVIVASCDLGLPWALLPLSYLETWERSSPTPESLGQGLPASTGPRPRGACAGLSVSLRSHGGDTSLCCPQSAQPPAPTPGEEEPVSVAERAGAGGRTQRGGQPGCQELLSGEQPGSAHP